MAILLLIKKINQTSKLVEADEADLVTSGYEAEAALTSCIGVKQLTHVSGC
jgi:hypothetical protein